MARGTLRPDAQGRWTGTLTIPATARAGTYAVAATCLVGGQQLFTYLPIPEVVLTTVPAAKAPVRFTE